VDKVGNLYVADCYWPGRVWKLAAGSSAPTVLLSGLGGIEDLAVDSAGNLYGTANVPRPRVWKLAEPTGSSPSTDLPFTGLTKPFGIAVDSVGNLYVVDDVLNKTISDRRVVKLSAGLTQTVLPFTGLTYPLGVAVDSTGTVYVTDDAVPPTNRSGPVNSRVVKLAPDSIQTELPFTGASMSPTPATIRC
jgi:serine/threonine-protein kinase